MTPARALTLLCGLPPLLAAGCRPAASRPSAPGPAPPPAAFTQAAGSAGLRFRHTDGSSGRKYFPEVMGPGCAFADFTGDGLPDVYLLNGAPLPGASGAAEGNRFYRNQGDGTFRDATEASGLKDGGYGIGCCAGDFDNDGRLDLYVTRLDGGRLYRSLGDGVFRDVTRAAGVDPGGFCAGSAFADYDSDGDLDLYVARYVRWSPETNVPCFGNSGQERLLVYCRPSVYPPEGDVLYRNEGGGRFTDVTQAAGMRVPPGRGLGVVWTDCDRDGDQDLFVANDMSANFLFINRGNGRFTEEGLSRGVAFGENGRPQASMGVDAVDVDGDGHVDLACTNFSGEYLTLWRSLGDGHFEDVSGEMGLLEATSPYVGFGMGFRDFDADGAPDLFVVNGHVTESAERFHLNASFAQPSLFLRNTGGGRLAPAADAGPAVAAPRVSRGAAFADYDRDGDVDVLVANWRNTPDLLQNSQRAGGHWLRLALQGTRSNRSAIGARVEVTAGGRTWVQEVRSGGSYCSQSELPLTFGLGAATAAERVRVRWPGGGEETRAGLTAGKEHVLTQAD